MKKTYNQVGLTARLRQIGLAALLVGTVGSAQAQTLPYTAAACNTGPGTYTDLGTTGNAIATANTDDANSIATPIGFTFRFNGTNFTDFVLNTNGFIKLGTTAPAAASFITYGEENTGGPVNGAETNLLLPFNIDLTAGSAGGTEYRVLTTGTAPNRVCTVQWKNVKDKPKATSATVAAQIATQYNNISFQLKMYETTNTIQFVYNTATAGAISADNFKYSNVGIKGSGTAANQLIMVQKASVSDWATVAFLASAYPAGTNTHNVRATVLPDQGRTYTFAIPVPSDAAVSLIYGYGKLLAPAGSPVTLRAAVRNAGTAALSNVVVSLSVSGANTVPAITQTLTSLAVGATATVTFPNIALSAVGNNTVTVTVPADGNNSNNLLTQPLVTSATDFSYIIPGASGAGGVGFAPGSESGFAAKFTLTSPRDITGVRAYINDATPTATAKTTVGETLYGVIVDAVSGAIIARSPDYIVTAADANAIHTFPVTTTLPAGDFLAGMVQIAPATALQFYPMGLQAETPTRTGTFFRIGGASSTPAAPSDAAGSNFGRYMLEAVTAAPATCATAGNIAVANVTQTGAQVSFTGPANGTGYQVVYVPTGTTPTAASPFAPGTTSPITLTGLAAGTGYDIYVRALCGATDRSGLAGPVFFSTPCAPPIINTFPYTQNFDVIANGQDLPCGVAINDANADGSTWEPAASITSGVTQIPVTRNASPLAMVYITNPDGITTADDWFYLPAMRFVAGTRYRVSFYYRNNSRPGLLDEALEVKYGTAATPAGQTNLLYSNTAIATGPVTPTSQSYTLANNTSTPAVADIAPTTTGLYYIGFHAISEADRGFLAVDDINVSTTLSATSAALTKAVSVYPNPSNTGTFKLDIAGANAKGGLQVEVTNLLGQRVYSSTAKDNFSNELNLSQLAAGIYSLKVKNGSEYTQQQISIVK